MTQCNAVYHSPDGKDSLVFSSNTLSCTLELGHESNMHKYYGMSPTSVDNSVNCDCPRCGDGL